LAQVGSMAGPSSFPAVTSIGLFLTAIWLASKASRLLGLSSSLLEIVVGLTLSPQVFNLLPEEYSVCVHEPHLDCTENKTLDRIAAGDLCSYDAYMRKAGHNFHHPVGQHSSETTSSASVGNASRAGSDSGIYSGGNRLLSVAGPMDPDELEYEDYDECLKRNCISQLSHKCLLTPNIFSLFGHCGVALMIFESGMHFDISKAEAAGPWAAVVSVLSTYLPLVTASIVMSVAFGYPFFPDSVCAGAALAPTSVSFALKLLHEQQCIKKDFGQTIITAAHVDDLLSLVLFNIVFSFADGGGFSVMRTLLPVIGSFAFLAAASFMAVRFWPWFADNLAYLAAKPGRDAADGSVTSREEALFFLMVSVLLGYAQATFFMGTHLWGCFVAGMSFALVREGQHPHQAHHVWIRQMKRVTVWMTRIFYSCTVAFSIPVDHFLTIRSFGRGAILGVGPCILTKVLCAFFMGDSRWVIGFAMVGRGEFAYLIAQMTAAAGMMGPEAYSIVIWALLWPTFFATFFFRFVLSRYALEPRAEVEARGEILDEEMFNRRSSGRGPTRDPRMSGHVPDLDVPDLDMISVEMVDEEAQNRRSSLQSPPRVERRDPVEAAASVSPDVPGSQKVHMASPGPSSQGARGSHNPDDRERHEEEEPPRHVANYLLSVAQQQQQQQQERQVAQVYQSREVIREAHAGPEDKDLGVSYRVQKPVAPFDPWEREHGMLPAYRARSGFVCCMAFRRLMID